MQDGDVLLFQSLDGGEIAIENNQIKMTTGFETAVYLSLFSPDDWFLNDVAETDDERLSSETNKIITKLPNVSKNYALLEQAIKDDLKWLTKQKLAQSYSVNISSNAINRVNIMIEIDGVELKFNEGWATNGN